MGVVAELRKPSLKWLLAMVPVCIVADALAPERQTLVFVLACLAVVPLAGLMGEATEHLAEHSGAGIGGLLNATFGNAAELIIALMALRAGLVDVVKASLTGSILGNVLLVAGASTLAGGLRYETQRFNVAGARIQSTMMTLAAIALVVPAAYHHLGGSVAAAREGLLSVDIALVLLATYACSLVFSLLTHRRLFDGPPADETIAAQAAARAWSRGKSVAVLAVATVFVGWVSEILVGAVEGAAHTFGMTNVFIGVIVVAVIGNAAEHSSAVTVAMKNRMDLSLGIALGSSVQIALFVAPVLVLASHVVAPRPMDLVFSPAEVLAIALSVIIAGQIAGDGESTWLEGVQLLAVYVILAIVFYFLPESVPSH